jgi:hypothetical protein
MSTEPRHAQVPVGPLVASIGAVILIVSLFLDWWDGVTAFTVYEFVDLLLLVLALATIVSLAGGLGLVRPAVSPGISLAVALFTVFVVVSQILNDPPAVSDPGPDHAFGIWMALGGSLLMAVGAVLGYAEISLAVEARPRERPEVDHEAATVTDRPPPADAPERP